MRDSAVCTLFELGGCVVRFNAIFRPENSSFFFFFFFTQSTPMYLGKYLHWHNLASRGLDYTISFGLPLTVAVRLCRR